MKAATTLTTPVISVRDETLIHRRFQHICRHFFFLLSIFPSFPVGLCGGLALSVGVCVRVCALTQTGWAGRGHGSPARLDPSRGTKQGEKEQCQAHWNQRPGLGLGFAPKGWTHFGGAGGPLEQEGGGGEELKTIIKSTTASEDRAGWERWLKPLRAASLLVPPLWSLLTFVLYITWSDIWKANLYAFCEQGVEGGKGLPPRIPQGSWQEGQHDWPQGETGNTSKPKAYDKCLWIIAALCKFDDNGRVVRGLKSLCKQSAHALVVFILLSASPPDETAIGCKGKYE